ncbi:hypothetical protein SAMN04488511_11831 [Pedobacter suwonensis]|uniref:Uncharacterized protein n=1 Tax=Pedobacter suwonensis TaxID=332999 RepID=A0A1I0U3Z5_9SPHI|nr:hypothetical protein [Pedobacter suwonensis]SFA57866.1 hypothetical protein SAMN04488511_11831 [Pedobacter suwonensis]
MVTSDTTDSKKGVSGTLRPEREAKARKKKAAPDWGTALQNIRITLLCFMVFHAGASYFQPPPSAW